MTVSKPTALARSRPARLAVGLGLGLLAVAAALAGGAPLGDGDLFWQLAMGRWILEHGALPAAGQDPFVLPPLQPDVHHEWLAQAGLAAVAQAGGLQALRLLGAFAAVGSLAAVFLVLRAAVPGPIALGMTALWWLLAEPHAVLRPHLLTWPLLVLFLGPGLAQLTRVAASTPTQGHGSSRSMATRALPWALALALWANTHASALAVPLYLFVLTLDGACAAFFGPGAAGVDAPARTWRDVGVRGAATLGSLAVIVWLQPAGPALLPYVAATPAINEGLSNEWLPLLGEDTWRTRPALVLGWVAIAVGCAFAAGSALWRGGWRGAVGRAAPGLLAALLALAHAATTRRMTALLFVPLLYIAHELPALRSQRARPGAQAAAALTLVAMVVALQAGGLRQGLKPRPLRAGAFPVHAAAVMEAIEPEGHIVHPDAWGGFLSWTLGGQVRVFADGRWPLVGRERIEDGVEMIARRSDPTARFDRYGISWLLQPLGLYLRSPPPDPARWLLVWRDKSSVLLVRRDEHFAANLKRICGFYADRAPLRARTTWPLKAQGPEGAATPTDVPSVLEACAALEAGRRS